MCQPSLAVKAQMLQIQSTCTSIALAQTTLMGLSIDTGRSVNNLEKMKKQKNHVIMFSTIKLLPQ